MCKRSETVMQWTFLKSQKPKDGDMWAPETGLSLEHVQSSLGSGWVQLYSWSSSLNKYHHLHWVFLASYKTHLHQLTQSFSKQSTGRSIHSRVGNKIPEPLSSLKHQKESQSIIHLIDWLGLLLMTLFWSMGHKQRYHLPEAYFPEKGKGSTKWEI